MNKKIQHLINLAKIIKCYRNAKINVEHPPLRIWIEPVSYCNLKCTFCPNRLMDQSLHGFMELDLFKIIIEQAADLGVLSLTTLAHSAIYSCKSSSDVLFGIINSAFTVISL